MSSPFPSSATTGEQAAISEKLDCSLEELIDSGRKPLDGNNNGSSNTGAITQSSVSAANKSGAISRTRAPHHHSRKVPYLAADEQFWSDNDQRHPRRVTLKHNRSLDLAVRGIVRRSNKRPSDQAESAGSALLYNSPSRRTVISTARDGHDQNQVSTYHRSAGPYGGPSDMASLQTMSSMHGSTGPAAGSYRESHPYMPVRVAAQPSIYNYGGVAGLAALGVQQQPPMPIANHHSQGGGYFIPYTLAPIITAPMPPVPMANMRLSPRDAALLSTDVVQKENGDIVVTFKQTNIITVKGDTGDLILDSGGFRTFSTRAVMNQALQPVGLRINEAAEGVNPQTVPTDTSAASSEDKTQDWEVSDGRSYLVTFTDGMVVKQSGTMTRQQMLARGSVMMQFLKQKKTNAEKQSRMMNKQQSNASGGQAGGRRSHQSSRKINRQKFDDNELPSTIPAAESIDTMEDDATAPVMSSSPID